MRCVDGVLQVTSGISGHHSSWECPVHQLVELAIKNRMLFIPGSVSSERKTRFRICSTVPNEKLQAGAELLCKLATT